MNEDVKLVPDIDYLKSITRNKLVYNRSGWLAFDHILFVSYLVLVIASMGYVSVDALIRGADYLPVLFFSLVFTAASVSWFYFNKLVKIEGREALQNKEDVIATLKYFYNDLTFNESQENILRDVQLCGVFSPGRCISVLFNDNVVFFHIATLSRGGIINPFASYFNYKKCCKIAEHFKNIQQGEA